MKIILIAVLSFFCLSIQGQNYEKMVFDPDIPDGYLLAVMPQSGHIEGVLILMPGFGQRAESIFPESKIHNVAFVNDILTVAIAGGRKLYADESIINKLNKAIQFVQSKFAIQSDNFVIGGFSAGGTISLRYAEYCNEPGSEAPMRPQGVFTVDSPVDLFQI